MLYFLISIIGILITLFFVVGTHESAHFFAARLLGVKVLRFSIGFGKALWRWHDKSGTEYILAWIPLGGYVKMLDTTAGEVPKAEEHLAFNHQPFYKKFLIIAAGPSINILCALLLYWLIFVIGFITLKPMIGTVTPQSIAAEAGLKPNQEIIRIDNQPTLSWPTILLQLVFHIGDQDQLRMEVKHGADQKITTHILNLTHWKLDELSPDPLTSLGIQPYAPKIPLIVHTIAEQSPAATYLQPGDLFIAINKTPLTTWQELTRLINQFPNQKVVFTIKRKNKTIDIPIILGSQRHLLFQQRGYLGVGPDLSSSKELLRTIQYPPLPALMHAWHEVINLSHLNFILIGKIITGKLSLQSLGGPITIFESAGDAFNYGILPFFGFLAFLSISVGVINLLPLPGLDGGHIFIQLLELLLRRPLSETVLINLYRVGFFIIFFMLFQALINDILRLFKPY